MALIADAGWRKTPSGRKIRKQQAAKHGGTEKVKEYRAAYYRRPEVRARYRAKHNANPDMIARREAWLKTRAERKAFWASEEGKALVRKRANDWIRNNRDKHNVTARKSRLKNPNLAISIRLRNRVRAVFRKRAGARKIYTMEQLVGCTFRELINHLQKYFEEGMTISALMRGEIHLDHQLPCAYFDLTDPNQQLACFNYRNLRPMWAPENIRKSDIIEVGGKKVRARHVRKVIPFAPPAC